MKAGDLVSTQCLIVYDLVLRVLSNSLEIEFKFSFSISLANKFVKYYGRNCDFLLDYYMLPTVNAINKPTYIAHSLFDIHSR
jgi:hypothetical protein